MEIICAVQQNETEQRVFEISTANVVLSATFQHRGTSVGSKLIVSFQDFHGNAEMTFSIAELFLRTMLLKPVFHSMHFARRRRSFRPRQMFKHRLLTKISPATSKMLEWKSGFILDKPPLTRMQMLTYIHTKKVLSLSLLAYNRMDLEIMWLMFRIYPTLEVGNFR